MRFQLFVAVGLTFAPLPALSQTVVVDLNETCAALAWDWRHAEHRMAFDYASELHEYKVPTMSDLHLAEANDLARATMTLSFMRENRCPLPKRVPRATTYSKAASACIKARKDKLENAPQLCDTEKWMPN